MDRGGMGVTLRALQPMGFARAGLGAVPGPVFRPRIPAARRAVRRLPKQGPRRGPVWRGARPRGLWRGPDAVRETGPGSASQRLRTAWPGGRRRRLRGVRPRRFGPQWAEQDLRGSARLADDRALPRGLAAPC